MEEFLVDVVQSALSLKRIDEDVVRSMAVAGAKAAMEALTDSVARFATLGQGCKAHCMVAGLQPVCHSEQRLLHNAIATSSPTVNLLRDGIFPQMTSASQCMVLTAFAIPSGSCIISEEPVLPWTKRELLDDVALAQYLSAPAEHLDRTEGLFPRVFEDIQNIDMFTALGAKIQMMAPQATDTEVRQRVLGLARIKSNAFANGLGTFAGLLNHSCVPNCEVRRQEGGSAIEIYAIRHIEPGEELCQAYISALDFPAVVRKVMLQTNFGFSCNCVRCNEEMLPTSSEYQDVTEQSFGDFQVQIVTGLNEAQTSESSHDPLFYQFLNDKCSLWSGCRFKTVYVLSKASEQYSEYIADVCTAYQSSTSENVLSACANPQGEAQLKLRASCEYLEKASAISNMLLLIQLKSHYIAWDSCKLDNARCIILDLITMYRHVSLLSHTEGFQTQDQIEASRRQIEDARAIAKNMIPRA